MRISGTIFVRFLSNFRCSKRLEKNSDKRGANSPPSKRYSRQNTFVKLQTISSCSIEWPTCACLHMTKSTGFYRYMDPNCSLMSTGRRMYCIWKWSFRPRAGQISCFGVILAKISRRTCDRDSHLFQATICGGVQGHVRDQCDSKDWVLFPVILAGRGWMLISQEFVTWFDRNLSGIESVQTFLIRLRVLYHLVWTSLNVHQYIS